MIVMLLILFIYWIWKGFTNLALEFDKNKWGYFAIGIISYYAGTLAGGFIVGLLSVFIIGLDDISDDTFTTPGWNILFVLCGIASCYGVYKLLKHRGEKEKALSKKDGIESIGVIDEN